MNDHADLQLWNEVARQCPWAMYFHSPGWAAVMAAADPTLQPAPLLFRLADDTPVVVPCLVRMRRRLLLKWQEYRSTVPGAYGGPIASRQLRADEVQLVARELARLPRARGRIVETPQKPLHFPAPFQARAMQTHVVDIAPDFATMRKQFSRGQKSNLNQARKKGVTIRRAETAADIDCYLDLYHETLQRWGETATAVYPRVLFETLFSREDGRGAFWLAEVDGVVVAGIVVLAWNRTLAYWHGAARQDYFKHYPNNLLHAEVLQWAAASGYTHYDMGPSAGLPGVARFKESFGARPVTFSAYRWK